MPHTSNNEMVPHASVILSSKPHINNITKNANRVFIFLFIWRPQCHKSAARFIITAVVKHAKCGEEIQEIKGEWNSWGLKKMWTRHSILKYTSCIFKAATLEQKNKKRLKLSSCFPFGRDPVRQIQLCHCSRTAISMNLIKRSLLWGSGTCNPVTLTIEYRV